ncbi:hypothetical protein AMIS_30070 [Actinoplanes missouriensis 431]|uniref:BON domain-containing protein n=1 Tax=Actinoplanes missouriensis (strain ATCC 14538 / DSM 43046 / CBS 188.64 / JCM 3121 / NBRC 102363 / NCIMB 12654 / NRRL B-3342 / UNCC 431) TaxID=512565 RepID=I0H5E0_ACTM4|nr:BON domain-containing protein [Actinoplanes missouriensis]BAL88227.1 hypothetical protein AMIS_30070 [Actinoplanes missouriensis 431]
MWPLPFDDAWFNRQPGGPAASPDAELTVAVFERIAREPALANEPVTVEVQNRVVTLGGTVSSLYARITAAELARSTPGVADICNRLTLSRTADVTDDVPHLQPDPFDELIARWDDEPMPAEQEHRPRRGRALPRFTAVFMCVLAVLLWVILSPWSAGGGLVVAVSCLVLAGTLELAARRADTSTGDAGAPGHASS